ncbi:hypothetical protein CGLO_14486 [Colletotrichum gloeosporioides Cg-14]
MQRFA